MWMEASSIISGVRPLKQEIERWAVVLQKVPSEDDPKVRNHGEGPY